MLTFARRSFGASEPGSVSASRSRTRRTNAGRGGPAMAGWPRASSTSSGGASIATRPPSGPNAATPRPDPHGDVDDQDDDEQQEGRAPRLLVLRVVRLPGVDEDEERQGVHRSAEVANVD